MNCCIECFRDSEIRSMIKSYEEIGNCDFCSSKNTYIHDINADNTSPIAFMIVDLIDTYVVSNVETAKQLKESLRDDWDIFNVDTEVIQILCQALIQKLNIYDHKYCNYDELFKKNVMIPGFTDSEFLNEFGIVRGYSWKEFSESLKYKNRFHSEIFNVKAFDSFLQTVGKSYPLGERFFRGRITSNQKGISEKDMGAPPLEKRTAGRINPEGIGVLYLASDKITVLHEVRAATFDYVTVGEFQLKKNIKVVNLANISSTSPFLYTDGFEKYAVNRNVLYELALEFAKPLRRSDSPLEYLSTQYIAEFIKSKGYDGVEYPSTLKKEGFNIAIFDEKLFECVEVNTLEVSEIFYKTQSKE